MSDQQPFSVELAGGRSVTSAKMPLVGPAGELTVDWPDEPPMTVVYSPGSWVSFTYETPPESIPHPIGSEVD